jgi:hypothetical protein
MLFCPGWLQTLTLLSLPQIPGIIGMYHHAWPCKFKFLMTGRKSQGDASRARAKTKKQDRKV